MKKILIFLLILLMLGGCKNKPVNNDPEKTESGVSCVGRDYVEMMRNYKIRDKSVSSEKDNEDFEQFMSDIFAEMITSSYMDMHFLVTDYKALGLEKPEVKLASFSYSLNTEMLDYYNGILEDLHTFDYEKLSNRQQYDYDTLEYYCYSEMGKVCFYRYDFIINERRNEIEDMMSYFTDYTFYDEESVDDYLVLVKDIDRFIDDILKYNYDMSNAGYPLTDEWIDYNQEVCNDFQNKIEDNVLIVSFDRKIDELDFLSEQKKADVKKENRQAVLDEVIPAYKRVVDTLEKYRGKTNKEKYALYKLDKDYADYLFMKTSSSNKTIDEMFQILEDAYSLLQAEFISCYYDKEQWDVALTAAGAEIAPFNLQGDEVLEYLRERTDKYLPVIGDVEYTLDELDPDVAPKTVLAYYWPNPVDNNNQNIIRTNPNNLAPGIESYSTLAHEGLPGHMFQSVFYSKTNPNNIRRYLDFIGYAEGWAVYSSYLAMLMADLGYEYVPSALFHETNYYFIEYSMYDIMTNYYGYSTDDIYDYMDENSIFIVNKDNVKLLRDFMLELSNGYTPYGIGYAEMINMREKVKQEKGSDFDLIDFNEALLINGPLPYNILNDYVFKRFGVN